MRACYRTVVKVSLRHCRQVTCQFERNYTLMYLSPQHIKNEQERPKKNPLVFFAEKGAVGHCTGNSHPKSIVTPLFRGQRWNGL